MEMFHYVWLSGIINQDTRFNSRAYLKLMSVETEHGMEFRQKPAQPSPQLQIHSFISSVSPSGWTGRLEWALRSRLIPSKHSGLFTEPLTTDHKPLRPNPPVYVISLNGCRKTTRTISRDLQRRWKRITLLNTALLSSPRQTTAAPCFTAHMGYFNKGKRSILCFNIE